MPHHSAVHPSIQSKEKYLICRTSGLPEKNVPDRLSPFIISVPANDHDLPHHVPPPPPLPLPTPLSFEPSSGVHKPDHTRLCTSLPFDALPLPFQT